METNYYNRSNNFSAPIRKEPKPYVPINIHKEKECKEHEETIIKHDIVKEKTSLFKNINNDDLLILGLIFLLLSDSNDDMLMIIALGYLFISSHTKKEET